MNVYVYIPEHQKGDEQEFHFEQLVWNVDGLIRATKQYGLEKRVINPFVFYEWIGLYEYDEEHIHEVNMEDPILIVEVRPGEHMLVDGIHRTLNAISKGIESIPCYVIPFHIQLNYLMNMEMAKEVMGLYRYANNKRSGIIHGVDL